MSDLVQSARDRLRELLSLRPELQVEDPNLDVALRLVALDLNRAVAACSLDGERAAPKARPAGGTAGVVNDRTPQASTSPILPDSRATEAGGPSARPHPDTTLWVPISANGLHDLIANCRLALAEDGVRPEEVLEELLEQLPVYAHAFARLATPAVAVPIG